MTVIKQTRTSSPFKRMRNAKNIFFVFALLAALMDAMRASCPICPYGWVEVAQTSTCVKLAHVHDKLNWQDARAACYTEAADLVKIVNDSMNQFIAGQVFNHPDLLFWIGLHDTEQEGVFLWLNETEEGEYFPWLSGQPNDSPMGQDCVSTNGYGQWNDEYCFYLLNFICEKAQDQAVAFAMEDPSCDASSTKEFQYQQQDPASLLPYLPRRLTLSGFSNLSSIGTCALNSFMMFPNSEGFLYNSETELCSPLHQMVAPTTVGALAVQPNEGDLYLVNRAGCTGRFKLFELSTGELVCLWHVSDVVVNYQAAKSFCAAMGSYLVSVKTLPKLAIIKILNKFLTVWVGIDRPVAGGPYVWVSDGEVLTAQQKEDLFINFIEGFDCVEFLAVPAKLNNLACFPLLTFICEKNLTTA